MTHTRVVGAIQANYLSLWDTLNSSDRSYTLVTNASVRALSPDVTEELTSPSVLLPKEHITVGVPMEENDIVASVASVTSQLDKHAQRASVKAGPFVLDGLLRVTRGTSLMDVLLHPPSLYLPMLDVNVTHDTGVIPSFTAQFLVVNRQGIHAVLEDPQAVTSGALESWAPPDDPAVSAAAGRGVTTSEPVTGPIDETTAAEILLATEVFKDTDFQTLCGVMSELTAASGISRLRMPAGSNVVLQGELGDALYVIEQGSVEVLVNESPTSTARKVATLGAGDIFGEMALLGDKRRSATVRAISDISLVVLSAESWRVLGPKLPKATINLMRLMTRRRSSGGLLLRRLG